MTDSKTNRGTTQKTQKGSRKRQNRRGNKKDNSAENAPIFLRKTYHMIDTCDPTIATWSEDGTAFVVKDTEKFASQIIGQFFKHNNFSSFVRQLNFYGFRKIKSDPLRLTDAANDVESKYWKFRHEKFQRGRPDLLVEIRKSNHAEMADKQDVESLRNEVKNLKTQMANMSQEMEKMASLVANVMQNQHLQNKTAAEPPVELPSAKKRKISDSPLPFSAPSNPVEKKPIELEALDDTSVDLDMFGPAPKVAPAPIAGSRQASLSSFTSTDEEILSSLFALDSTDDVNVLKQKEASLQNYRFPDKRTGCAGVDGPAAQSAGAGAGEGLDPVLMARLRNALVVLPKHLQQLFVDRIVSFVVDPVSFKKQVDAISSLAMAASADACNRMDGSTADPSQTTALASAVMGAWLSRYGSPSALEHAIGNPCAHSSEILTGQVSNAELPSLPTTTSLGNFAAAPQEAPQQEQEHSSLMPAFDAPLANPMTVIRQPSPFNMNSTLVASRQHD